MTVARRAWVALVVLFVVAVGSSAATFAVAGSASGRVARFRAETAVLDATMWSLRSEFYSYDDQMNMYVAVLAGGDTSDDLAEVTFQQAVRARAAMGRDLDAAQRRAPAQMQADLTRLRADFNAYNGFADQTRTAAQAHDVQRAVFLSTRGNLEPSDDIMPTLDRLSAQSRHATAADLAALQAGQADVRRIAVLSAVAVALLVAALAVGTRRFLVVPLAGLRRGIAATADGGRGARLDVVRRDEIGQVAEAFNGLLAEIEAHEREIGAAQAEREASLASGCSASPSSGCATGPRSSSTTRPSRS